jgi:hypothetical protein
MGPVANGRGEEEEENLSAFKTPDSIHLLNNLVLRESISGVSRRVRLPRGGGVQRRGRGRWRKVDEDIDRRRGLAPSIFEAFV